MRTRWRPPTSRVRPKTQARSHPPRVIHGRLLLFPDQTRSLRRCKTQSILRENRDACSCERGRVWLRGRLCYA